MTNSFGRTVNELFGVCVPHATAFQVIVHVCSFTKLLQMDLVQKLFQSVTVNSSLLGKLALLH